MKIPKLKWWQWALAVLLIIGFIQTIFDPATWSAEVRAERDAKYQAAQEAEKKKEADAKAARIAADPCRQDIAVANVTMLERANPFIRFNTSASMPTLIVRKSFWLSTGPDAQQGILAAYDCAIAGRGNHLVGIDLVEGIGMEPFAQFDGADLIGMRNRRPASITERLKN